MKSLPNKAALISGRYQPTAKYWIDWPICTVAARIVRGRYTPRKISSTLASPRLAWLTTGTRSAGGAATKACP
ncbi:hypothetical protein G6F24_018878 [Rhizopus arrhizus]|nr:hypothetical protein G6F24_018878 [Rhizopus arrhizus]